MCGVSRFLNVNFAASRFSEYNDRRATPAIFLAHGRDEGKLGTYSEIHIPLILPAL